MTTYERALARLPARLRAEIRFTPERCHSPDDAIPLRPPREVAERALIVAGIVVAANGSIHPRHVNAWLRRERLWDPVTAREREFLLGREPPEHTRIWAGWQVEALWVLAWALERVPELGDVTGQCDPVLALAALPRVGKRTESFRAKARLRPTCDILDQLSIVYQVRCRVHDAWSRACGTVLEIPGMPMRIVRKDPTKAPPQAPGGVDEGVALEWHRALEWLAPLGEEGWDDVSIDT